MIKIRLFRNRNREKEPTDIDALSEEPFAENISAEDFHKWAINMDWLRTNVSIWPDGDEDWLYIKPEGDTAGFRMVKGINSKLEFDGIL